MNSNHPSPNRSSRRNLPSLSAVRAFEAAARHASFRSAAEELNVTHSAISHQVKALERALGIALFARHARSVELTEEGAILFPIVRESFDHIADGIALLNRRQLQGVLTIQVYVTVAMRWLLPKLPTFTRDNPDIRIAIATAYTDWDFNREHADAGIVFADPANNDLEVSPLYRGRLFPVCAPDLVDSGLKTPADLVNFRLLDVYTAPADWPRWLEVAGVDPDKTEVERASFDSYILALEAAASGDGVALANWMFARADIESGRLVRPFDSVIDQPTPLSFVCPRERREEPRIAAFRDWLIKEIQSDGRLVEGA